MATKRKGEPIAFSEALRARAGFVLADCDPTIALHPKLG